MYHCTIAVCLQRKQNKMVFEIHPVFQGIGCAKDPDIASNIACQRRRFQNQHLSRLQSRTAHSTLKIDSISHAWHHRGVWCYQTKLKDSYCARGICIIVRKLVVTEHGKLFKSVAWFLEPMMVVMLREKWYMFSKKVGLFCPVASLLASLKSRMLNFCIFVSAWRQPWQWDL